MSAQTDIATDLTRIIGAKSDLKTSIEGKGVTVPSATKIDGYAALVDQIQQGGGGGHTGTVDTAGLQALGWDSDDIQWLQDHVWWDAEDDAEWAVTEANKAFGPTGATPLTWSNYANQRYNPDLRYFPKLGTPTGTSMNYKFNAFPHIVAIPTHGWDMSAKTDFGGCFNSCFVLCSIGDISYWVTSAATTIGNMFYNCMGIEEIDVSHWNTSNVLAMSNTFGNCYRLKTLDISSWSFIKVTNMSGMLNGCAGLQSLKLPTSINAPQVTNITSLLNNCYNLQEITDINLLAASLTIAPNVFTHCRSLKKIKITVSSTALSDIKGLCYSAYCCQEIDLTGIDTTGCAQSGLGTAASSSPTAECPTASTIKLGPGFFNGTFTTLYAQSAYSWTRDSIYESLYTSQTTRDSNSNAVTVKLATQAYDRLSAQDISDIATKNITLTRG